MTMEHSPCCTAPAAEAAGCLVCGAPSDEAAGSLVCGTSAGGGVGCLVCGAPSDEVAGSLVCGTPAGGGVGCLVCGTSAGGEAGCLVCGAPIVYEEERERQCALCHKDYVSGAVCVNGHYICDACHAANTDDILALLKDTSEKDATLLLSQTMALPSVHMHGPEHHRLVPAVLLTAYQNCGGELDLPAALATATERAKQLPGGTCGYWGVCGAAAGAGIYAGIVTGSNPLNMQAWSLPQILTARTIERIASYGGVRCCKRTSFLAVAEAAAWTRATLGVDIIASKPVCTWSARNQECLGPRCPYSRV